MRRTRKLSNNIDKSKVGEPVRLAHYYILRKVISADRSYKSSCWTAGRFYALRRGCVGENKEQSALVFCGSMTRKKHVVS